MAEQQPERTHASFVNWSAGSDASLTNQGGGEPTCGPDEGYWDNMWPDSADQEVTGPVHESRLLEMVEDGFDPRALATMAETDPDAYAALVQSYDVQR